jgi:hypothetical protein
MWERKETALRLRTKREERKKERRKKKEQVTISEVYKNNT